jgi:iron(III) transport system ATP-binding protein
MSAELQVDRLRKDFGTGRPAVDGVSFTIAAGEIVVLLGPSGCGKTTTLRCVAGLEHPTGGVIRIGGEVISAPEQGILVPPRARNFGMVFQSYAVWPHMTVRQNVAYPLKNRGLDGAAQKRMIMEALELVDLAAYVDRPVTALSGGQMQRVALARSMVYHPRLLLLDEPLSNLDAQLRLRLRDDLRRIVKAAGLTALYVTHDQAEAVVLGDRIGVMRDGRLLQLSTATDLYNDPADPFVAAFTGASNRIDGTLRDQSGGIGAVEAGNGQVIHAKLHGALVPGAPVSVMVRPENIQLGTAEGSVDARVLQAHYQGVQTVYALDLLGTRIEAVEMGTAPRYAEGDTVPVRLPPAQCMAYAAGGAPLNPVATT